MQVKLIGTTTIVEPQRKWKAVQHSLGPNNDAKVEKFVELLKSYLEGLVAKTSGALTLPPLLDDVVQVSRAGGSTKITILVPPPSKVHLLDKILAFLGAEPEFKKPRSGFSGQDVLVDTPLGDLKAYSPADVPPKSNGVKHSGVKRPENY